MQMNVHVCVYLSVFQTFPLVGGMTSRSLREYMAILMQVLSQCIAIFHHGYTHHPTAPPCRSSASRNDNQEVFKHIQTPSVIPMCRFA